jgi:heme oxygenase (biliverdin-IX-beta and delta-forming)
VVEFETATGTALAAVDPGAEFLTRLRAETRMLHATTERHLAPAERLQDVHGYVRLLRTLYPLYASVEARLPSFAAFLALDPPLDVVARRRAHLLLADLRALGVDPDPRGDMRAAAAPGIGHFAHALGALYVIEGSRLGGRLLARQVAANIGGSTLGALSFLRSAGSDVGPLWTEYCAALRGYARHADVRSRDAVIAGALETFGQFDRGLRRWTP